MAIPAVTREYTPGSCRNSRNRKRHPPPWEMRLDSPALHAEMLHGPRKLNKINTSNRGHGTVGCWAMGVYFPLSQILFILISAPKVGSLVLTQMSKFPDNIDVWQYPPTVSFSRPKMEKRRGLVSWFCISPSPHSPASSQVYSLFISFLNNFMRLG